MTIDANRMAVAVAALVGLEFRGTARAASTEMFLFGPDVATQHRGRSLTGPRNGLHMQCAWRVMIGPSVIVASSDGSGGSAPWRYRDARLAGFGGGRKRRVESVALTGAQDLEMRFDDGETLEVFVDSSRRSVECYRIVDRLGEDAVVVGGG